MPKPNVFYHSFGTPELYGLIRESAGSDFDVAVLDADDDAERYRKLALCEAVICAATPLRKRHLDAAPRLRVVHHQGVGWQDTTDWQEIGRRGLPLALTPEGTTVSVAEHAILLMLAASRRLAFADHELRQGHWHVNSLRPVSRELFSKTIGYVGMGRIAQAVAERLKAFGCTGLYHDPSVALPAAEAERLALRRAELDEVLAEADILSLHVPLQESTRGLIGEAALARMKPGAVLVNTSRGGIVDEAALARALTHGNLLAAGIDVFDSEPPRADNPLLGLANVVLTPHISAGTRDAMRQKMDALFANLRGFFASGALVNRVALP